MAEHSGALPCTQTAPGCRAVAEALWPSQTPRRPRATPRRVRAAVS